MSADPPTKLASSWPIHEVGRNADIFPPEAGRLLAGEFGAGAHRRPPSLRTAARRRRTSSSRSSSFRRATSRIYKRVVAAARQRHRHRREAESGRTRSCTRTRRCTEHTKIIAFEPHLHAPGVRMCLEAIWGHNIQTLNCVGYDHNWVKQYVYDDDAAPLLPKGTIVHLIGFLDTTSAQQESRGPAELGRAAAAVRSPTCSSTSATRCRSPRSSSRRRWRKRRAEDEEPGTTTTSAARSCWAPPLPQG